MSRPKMRGGDMAIVSPGCQNGNVAFSTGTSGSCTHGRVASVTFSDIKQNTQADAFFEQLVPSTRTSLLEFGDKYKGSGYS